METEGVGRGHRAKNRRPAVQQGQRSALERQTDWSKPRLEAIFQLCPTCAPSNAPAPEAELRSQGTTLGLPVAARGCPPCSKLSLHSDTHPKRLAQVLPPTSPPAFPATRSPIAPRCAGNSYLRAQPQATAIAGSGPEVAVLRLLQAASPGRGGSGRAGGAVPAAELLRVAGPLRAEAALLSTHSERPHPFPPRDPSACRPEPHPRREDASSRASLRHVAKLETPTVHLFRAHPCRVGALTSHPASPWEANSKPSRGHNPLPSGLPPHLRLAGPGPPPSAGLASSSNLAVLLGTKPPS
ncbi:unnamed protein product [Rangifer tarandus platyrhynchus]|uniref:Uncharacterized protein n=1 Tax=Rangifer tarandus platyrhynchus TaxID=3082113 RepID=A0AC59ZA76_RANTA